MATNNTTTKPLHSRRGAPLLPRSLSLPSHQENDVVGGSLMAEQTDELPSPLTPIPPTSLAQELQSPGDCLPSPLFIITLEYF